tara:strand:- start:171 stop:893 length:723 start_codon:yes stop_codon:yes gene_type:complete
MSHFVPDKIIVVSNSGKTSHEKIGYSGLKMRVVHNGINPKSFSTEMREMDSEKLRGKLNIQPQDFVIGSVGRDNPYKDFKNLIKAIVALSKTTQQLKVLIIGPEIDKNEEIKTLIEEHNLQEIFNLIGNQTDMVPWYGVMDLLVLPSKSEAFPMVLIEALCSGTMCCSTDVGDVKGYILEEEFVCKPSNPDALSQLIKKIMIMPKLELTGVIKKHRDRVAALYQIKEMAQKYDKIYEEVL